MNPLVLGADSGPPPLSLGCLRSPSVTLRVRSFESHAWAHSSASEKGLPPFQVQASLWGWPGVRRGPGLPVHPGPALHPLTLASLSPQRRGVGWGPRRCSLPGPCQAPPPASSTSRSTCARPWMANARRSPRYRLAPHPVSLHTVPMLRLCSPSPDVTLGCALIPSLSQVPPAPAAIMSSPDSAREGLGAEGQAN